MSDADAVATPVRAGSAPAAGSGRRRVRDLPPVRLVIFVVDRVLRGPVLEGRLADTGWPAGLRGIAIAAIACYVALVGVTAAAALLRRGTLMYAPDAMTLPRSAFGLMIVGIAMSMACLLTAALHLRLWARAAVVVVVVSIVLSFVDFTELGPGACALLGCVAAMLVLVGVRWRRRFHWGEFLASMIIIGLALVIMLPLAQRSGSAGGGVDLGLGLLGLAIPQLWAIATPLGLLGGAALIELTASTTVWVVTGVWAAIHRARGRRLGIGICVGLVVAARVVQAGYDIATDVSAGTSSPASLLLGAGEFAIVLAAAWAVSELALRRPRTTFRPDADDITTGWSSRSLPVAVIVAASLIGPSFVGQILRGLHVPRQLWTAVGDIGGPYQLSITVSASAVLMAVLAVVLAWRGRRRSSLVLASGACAAALVVINPLLGLAVARDGLLLGADAIALVVAIWLIVTRRMVAEAGVALVTVWLLTFAYQYREAITEPITAVLALSGVAAGLVGGLIWRLLTDHAWTRADTPGFPVSARVLLALANALFAVVAVAVTALSRGSFVLRLDVIEVSGDTTLGFTLLLAVIAAAVISAVSGRLVREVPGGPRMPRIRPVRGAQPPS